MSKIPLIMIISIVILVAISGCTNKDNLVKTTGINKIVDDTKTDVREVRENGSVGVENGSVVDTATTDARENVRMTIYGDLELTIELENTKTTFNKGENIDATLTFKNVGDKSISFRNVDIYMEVYNNSGEEDVIHISPENSSERMIIEPGKPIVEKILWDQTYGTIKKAVPSGEYNIVGKLDADTEDLEQYNLATDPITITIEEGHK